MKRHQRVAINKAEITRRCRPLGPFLRGYDAYRWGQAITDNPYAPPRSRDWSFWNSGWEWGKQRAKERGLTNEST